MDEVQTLVKTFADEFNRSFPQLGVMLEVRSQYANQGSFRGHSSIYPSLDVSPNLGVDVSIFFKDYGSYGTQIGLLFERAKEAFPQNKVFLRQRNRGQAVCILMSGDAAPPGLPNLAQQVAASLAELIRLADPLFSALFDEASDIAGGLTTALSYDLVEAPEGRAFTVMHIYRERSRKLVEAKKHQVRKKTGRLVCEVCDFDFEQTYGERGDGFIECHHIRPVKSLGDGSRTSVDDLSLLCSNCHRMIHNKQPWATVAELQEIVERARPSGRTA